MLLSPIQIFLSSVCGLHYCRLCLIPSLFFHIGILCFPRKFVRWLTVSLFIFISHFPIVLMRIYIIMYCYDFLSYACIFLFICELELELELEYSCHGYLIISHYIYLILPLLPKSELLSFANLTSWRYATFNAHVLNSLGCINFTCSVVFVTLTTASGNVRRCVPYIVRTL